MKEIFAILQRNGLIKRGRANKDLIMSTKLSGLLDVADEISSTMANPPLQEASAYVHCASIGLGGGRDECAGEECRTVKVDQLARFAALYSDKVVAHNFFSDFSPTYGHPPSKDSWDFRRAFFDDVRVLLCARPLIEEGVIVLFTPARSSCPACVASELLGDAAGARLRKAAARLGREFLREAKAEFARDEASYFATCEAPGRFFEHKAVVIPFFEENPVCLQQWPRLLKLANAGGKAQLSRAQMHALGLDRLVARLVFDSLAYQMTVSRAVGASLVTHRELDVSALQYVSGDARLQKTNAVTTANMKAIVPFADGVPVADLLRLRRREQGAFLAFRAALNRALSEVKSESNCLTDRHARQLYSDVIAPELARLDRKVGEAKRDLVREPLTTGAGIVAVLVFGLYSGLIPAEFSVAAKTLGLGKVLYDTVKKAASLADVQRGIRSDDFYFLWKVRHLARRAREHVLL